MIASPRIGQVVQCWYAAKVRAARPLHARVAVVEIVSRGRPRNHGVRIDGRLYAVPCGNLRTPKPELSAA